MNESQLSRARDACSRHPFLQQFECSHEYSYYQSWCSSHPYLPIIAVTAYVIAIFSGRRFMRQRDACDLRRQLLLWNAFLAAFSILGAFRVGTELTHLASDSGFHGILCYTATDNVTSLWIFSFILSKYAELFDTFFIVARKKPLMFLHWYHHVTVLLFSWYTLASGSSSMRILAFVNMVIHSHMYTYYAVIAAGIRVANIISLIITLMQIIQMILGMFFLLRINWTLSTGIQCSESWLTILTGLLMYASYLILFVDFFVKRYLLTPCRKEEAITHKKK